MESSEKPNSSAYNNNTTAPNFMIDPETSSPPPTSDKSNNDIKKPGNSLSYKTILIGILIIISVISIIINIVLFIKYKKNQNVKMDISFQKMINPYAINVN